jgi:hypothetical protein
LKARLVRATQNPKFDKPDKAMKRPAWDHVYDALWLLAVGSEDKDAQDE